LYIIFNFFYHAGVVGEQKRSIFLKERTKHQHESVGVLSVTHGQCDAKPAVSFPAVEHHRCSCATRLYCSVTEAHVCMCVCLSNLPRVALESATAGSRTLQAVDLKSIPHCRATQGWGRNVTKHSGGRSWGWRGPDILKICRRGQSMHRPPPP